MKGSSTGALHAEAPLRHPCATWCPPWGSAAAAPACLCSTRSELTGAFSCRLASSSFLHDSFAHLCTSSYALWTIAPQVESVLGSPTFISIYYLSGLAGNVLSFEYGDAITVGASSATFGLIGARSCCEHAQRQPPAAPCAPG